MSTRSRTAQGVVVRIARDPSLVRMVRLVAASVARRADRDEDFVEEVRLAVGEACALLLGDHPDLHSDPVTVEIRVDGALEVEVSSSGRIPVTDPPDSDIDGTQPWALLRGLVDGFAVSQDEGRTVVRMSWPSA